jgi:hypothetical protein
LKPSTVYVVLVIRSVLVKNTSEFATGYPVVSNLLGTTKIIGNETGLYPVVLSFTG